MASSSSSSSLSVSLSLLVLVVLRQLSESNRLTVELLPDVLAVTVEFLQAAYCFPLHWFGLLVGKKSFNAHLLVLKPEGH